MEVAIVPKNKRTRNHYLPRFLLNRFSSSTSRDTHWIWQIQASGQATEISTRDAAVAKKFYGDDERAENALGLVEGRLASTLALVDRDGDPNDKREDLGLLMHILSARTRSFERISPE